MLKKLFTVLLFLSAYQMGSSQGHFTLPVTIKYHFKPAPDTAKVDTSKAILQVKYQFNWVDDTADRAHPYTEDMVVFTDGKTTVYSSYDELVTFPAENRRYEEMRKAGINPIMRFTVPNTEWVMYTHAGKDTMDIVEAIVETYYIAKSYRPTIAWTIQADSAKNILGFNCRQATGIFRGRVYTAWFAPDIPVPYGPWKLSGLPGIILEAKDSKNDVMFKAITISKTTDTSPLQYPANQKLQPIALKRMNELSNYYRAHPFEALKASGIELTPANGSSSTEPVINIISGNNPMELPEKNK